MADGLINYAGDAPLFLSYTRTPDRSRGYGGGYPRSSGRTKTPGSGAKDEELPEALPLQGQFLANQDRAYNGLISKAYTETGGDQYFMKMHPDYKRANQMLGSDVQNKITGKMNLDLAKEHIKLDPDSFEMDYDVATGMFIPKEMVYSDQQGNQMVRRARRKRDQTTMAMTDPHVQNGILQKIEFDMGVPDRAAYDSFIKGLDAAANDYEIDRTSFNMAGNGQISTAQQVVIGQFGSGEYAFDNKVTYKNNHQALSSWTNDFLAAGTGSEVERVFAEEFWSNANTGGRTYNFTKKDAEGNVLKDKDGKAIIESRIIDQRVHDDPNIAAREYREVMANTIHDAIKGRMDEFAEPEKTRFKVGGLDLNKKGEGTTDPAAPNRLREILEGDARVGVKTKHVIGAQSGEIREVDMKIAHLSGISLKNVLPGTSMGKAVDAGLNLSNADGQLIVNNKVNDLGNLPTPALNQMYVSEINMIYSDMAPKNIKGQETISDQLIDEMNKGDREGPEDTEFFNPGALPPALKAEYDKLKEENTLYMDVTLFVPDDAEAAKSLFESGKIVAHEYDEGKIKEGKVLEEDISTLWFEDLNDQMQDQGNLNYTDNTVVIGGKEFDGGMYVKAQVTLADTGDDIMTNMLQEGLKARLKADQQDRARFMDTNQSYIDNIQAGFENVKKTAEYLKANR